MDFGRDPYGPIDFTSCVGYPHDMPSNTLKWLPRFSGDNAISTFDHMEAFYKVTQDNDITHEDVAMKLLVNSLDGNAYILFMNISDNSITGFDNFVEQFMKERDSKYDDKYLLCQSYDFRKKKNENV